MTGVAERILFEPGDHWSLDPKISKALPDVSKNWRFQSAN